MTTIVKNIDGCDIEHEALMLQEYGEEVMCAGWNPQLALAIESSVAQTSKFANDRGLTAIPDFIPDFALPAAAEDVIDSDIPLRSSAFPKCP